MLVRLVSKNVSFLLPAWSYFYTGEYSKLRKKIVSRHKIKPHVPWNERSKRDDETALSKVNSSRLKTRPCFNFLVLRAHANDLTREMHAIPMSWKLPQYPPLESAGPMRTTIQGDSKGAHQPPSYMQNINDPQQHWFFYEKNHYLFLLSFTFKRIW